MFDGEDLLRKATDVYCCCCVGDPKRKRLGGPVRSPDAKVLEAAHRKMVDTKKQREDFRKALVDIVT